MLNQSVGIIYSSYCLIQAFVWQRLAQLAQRSSGFVVLAQAQQKDRTCLWLLVKA